MAAQGVVITLDTWILGWRPRDLNTGNFPGKFADSLEGPEAFFRVSF